MRKREVLLFVYNANSGIASAVLDYAKKYISPDTYECQLCMVSYGALGKKKEWKEFIASLPYKTRFMYRGEFRETHSDINVPLPAIVLFKKQGPEVILDAHDFDQIDTLESLISILKKRL